MLLQTKNTSRQMLGRGPWFLSMVLKGETPSTLCGRSNSKHTLVLGSDILLGDWTLALKKRNK